ncbi:carboxyl-terminal processing protease [Flexibacter flexilis DSM 6793]|uniref:Carboxyl-terminal processing protease n=1 Tax=Flexibacter flexilis DSM 6793 TaxID=927664 RepID=A0A1I1DL56_9BACT|nr:S41 family peptidase [Flexibacter flexilis]SFB75156.1 carboxyl-terminal processing protease [Flexibacter flexilis DSM 6793]
MKKLLTLAWLLCGLVAFSQNKYQQDFEEFWNDVNTSHAYLDKQQIDWPKVREIYRPIFANVQNDSDFIKNLEKVINELYNGHISLNTNLNSSNKLVPSGADLFAEKKGNHFFVSDLRKGYEAEACGLRVGMEIVKFNDAPILPQLKAFLPTYTNQHSAAMYEYALAMLLAGTHDNPRKITVLEKGKEKAFYLDENKITQSPFLLISKKLNPQTGYIKINNSLFLNNLIAAFDAALDSLLDTQTLVLDLTETPSGGNSTVARAILGRFITQKAAYQQHEFDEKEFGTRRYWVEYVLPRARPYKGKLIVMVGHWTGSMGEGMTIGFDALQRATIVGTPMAKLLGAISGFQASQTRIGYQFPTERLYHLNGTPREDFVPPIRTQNLKQTWEKVNELIR